MRRAKRPMLGLVRSGSKNRMFTEVPRRLGKYCSSRVEPGMVSVEWALTAPVFILFTVLCLAVIVYTNTIAVTTHAARECARVYALGMGEKQAERVVEEVAGDEAHVTITREDEYVRVKVEQAPVEALDFLGFIVSAQYLALLEPGVTP